MRHEIEKKIIDDVSLEAVGGGFSRKTEHEVKYSENDFVNFRIKNLHTGEYIDKIGRIDEIRNDCYIIEAEEGYYKVPKALLVSKFIPILNDEPTIDQ